MAGKRKPPKLREKQGCFVTDVYKPNGRRTTISFGSPGHRTVGEIYAAFGQWLDLFNQHPHRMFRFKNPYEAIDNLIKGNTIPSPSTMARCSEPGPSRPSPARNAAKEPAIALDIDGTISQAPEFFAFLSRQWPGPVYVITYREDRKRAMAELKAWGICCDELHMVGMDDSKADCLEKLQNVRYLFEDMDEAIGDVPESITCFKVRNTENFDFDEGRWHRLGTYTR